MLSFEEFRKLSAAYNVLPFVETLITDLHTPVSTYLALREPGKPSFLFESVERDERVGRFSFVGVGSETTPRQGAGGVMVVEGGRSRTIAGNIFDALAAFTSRFHQAPVPADPEMPGPGGGDRSYVGLAGGFVGYLGYPAVRHLERVPLPPDEPGSCDESRFDLFPGIVRFDHRRQ